MIQKKKNQVKESVFWGLLRISCVFDITKENKSQLQSPGTPSGQYSESLTHGGTKMCVHHKTFNVVRRSLGV